MVALTHSPWQMLWLRADLLGADPLKSVAVVASRLETGPSVKGLRWRAALIVSAKTGRASSSPTAHQLLDVKLH